MTVPVYQGHRGWLGWGQPALLSEAQAQEHARLLRAEGKCGAVCETDHRGWAACDRSEHDDDGSHIDGRLAVVWPTDVQATTAYLVFCVGDDGVVRGAGIFSEPRPTTAGSGLFMLCPDGVVGRGKTYTEAEADLRAQLRQLGSMFGRDGSPVRRMVDELADGARSAMLAADEVSP